MLLIIKIALTFFVMGFIMIGLTGITLCYQLTQKFNSTIRDILYINVALITLVTILMNMSYRGVPFIILYGAVLMFIGFCSLPVKLFMKDY